MYSLVFAKGERVIKSEPITSVILSHNPEDPLNVNLTMFRCITCGSPLGQYKGFVYSIHPGSNPQPLPWIQRCDTCKHKYSVNAIV